MECGATYNRLPSTRAEAILIAGGFRGLETTDRIGAARTALARIIAELKPVPWSPEHCQAAATVAARFGIIGELGG